jgi:hypothetical protein
MAAAACTRLLLAAAAAVLAAAGVALWVDPTVGPLELSPLGGRFAGSWVVMLGVLAGWGAAGGGEDEVRVAALALVALPAGALAAVARTQPELGSATAIYLGALALFVVSGVAVLRALDQPRVSRSPISTPSLIAES